MISEPEVILVVDDDERVLKTFARNLSLAGYRTLTAPGGHAALQIYTANHPDITLVDVRMPLMDGFEVLEQIRSRDADAEVVLVTGHGDMDTAIQALRAGASDFIPKPVEQDVLDAVLRHAKDRLHLKQNLRAAEQALRRANDELESRVTQRTAQLFEANQRLQIEMAERKRLEERLEIIYQLGRELTLLHDETAIIRRTLEIAAQVIPFDFANCGLIDDKSHELVLRYCWVKNTLYPVELRLPLDGNLGISVAVIQQRQALNIPDVTQDPRYVAMSEDALVRSELCVPLIVGESVTGVLNIESNERYAFTNSDAQILQTLAGQTAVALENARLYTAIQRSARELAALNSATNAMTSNLDLNTVLKRAIVEVNTLLEAEDASVLLYDSESHDLVFAAVASNQAAEALFGRHLPADQGIVGWALAHRQPILVENVQEDPRFYRDIDTMTGFTTRSLLAVPLIVKERVIGVIEAINKIGGVFLPHDLELLEALGNSAAIALDNARLYQDLQTQMRVVRETQTQLLHSEKIAALGRLVASISHEINNPLQSIQGCLTLADEELKGERRQAKLTRYLAVAEDEIERIAAIVRRVRDFYRPATQEPQPTDLHAVLQSVLELAGKQLQHSGVVVERVWANTLPAIHTNPDHLKQVFLNLVLNAIDAMPDGGVLYIRTTVNADMAQIEFTDTGVGMSEETQARLFEPFFTTKPQGSGLGLSISYGIIEAHHGKITVKSQPGVGTTFTLMLPLQ